MNVHDIARARAADYAVQIEGADFTPEEVTVEVMRAHLSPSGEPIDLPDGWAEYCSDGEDIEIEWLTLLAEETKRAMM